MKLVISFILSERYLKASQSPNGGEKADAGAALTDNTNMCLDKPWNGGTPYDTSTLG